MVESNHSYLERLLDELTDVEAAIVDILDRSSINAIDWPDGFIGFARYSWEESAAELQAARMAALARIVDFETRYRLLFPHPTPEISRKIEKCFGMLRRWLERSQADHSLPSNVDTAVTLAQANLQSLRMLTGLLLKDAWRTRLLVDTNVLCDNLDLTVHRAKLGPKYVVHIAPVVFRELDELKRNGRNPDIREAARRADKRLKGIRDNGDVRTGARVAGDVFAVFEHREPRGDGLPDWLDMGVPDDRFVASSLLLQSSHPGSLVVVATGDMNLQNKLAVVGLPFIELPS